MTVERLSPEALAARLARFPRLALGHGATPIDALPRLGAALGVDLFVKRDDCTGLGGGGNKVRKLEFLLGDALDKGCDTVLTAGALQSNHARITAAAAARLGLSCELLLSEPADPRGPAYGASGNRLLDDLFGAQVQILPPDTDSGPALAARADALRAAGARPYVIPVGGSNALGTLGYLAAALEIADPSIAGAFDVIVLPSGSGGTQAGLALAAALLGAPWQVWGISVGRLADAQGEIIRALGSACCSLIGRSIPDPLPITVFDGARGPGYGRPDLSTRAAMWDAARREGLLLDPVYTAKAMAGLSMLIGTDAVPKGARVLFWHTGGAPAIFSYPGLFQERTAAIDPVTAI